MKINKTVKQKEYIIVMNNLLEMLYFNYKNNMTKEIEKSMLKFMKVLQKEYTKDYPKDYDISTCDIFEDITFRSTKKLR